MSDEKVISIDWSALFKPIEGLQCGDGLSNRLEIEREVIPIIFVPGIMGSRLRNVDGKKVWDPDAAWFMLKRYGLVSVDAAERKALTIGGRFEKDYLSVMEDDETHNKNFRSDEDAGRVKRGWGGVSWSSYGPFLEALQTKGDDNDWTEPIRHCFEFPVHAHGYNWTASNADSGKKLAQNINDVIAHYQANGRMCRQVILVTHSMGGLVARAACKLHGAEEKVLGVVHGVQPVFGSPAAYWRMKGGFERPQGGPTGTVWDWFRNPLKMTKHVVLGTVGAWVLGTNGEEVTSLLGNMPGGLQLLPNKLYADNAGNKQWLLYEDSRGESVALPQSDPYEEIYRKQDEFYRLVDPAWLDPGASTLEPKNSLIDSDSPWEEYEMNLKSAERFHDRLCTHVHPQTFQFYSEGLPTAECIKFMREVHSFGGKAKRVLSLLKNAAPGTAASTATSGAVKASFGLPAFTAGGLAVSGAYMLAHALYQDSDSSANRGGFRAYVPEGDVMAPDPGQVPEFEDADGMPDIDPSAESVFVYTLQPPTGSGDGTVPVSSAKGLPAQVRGWANDAVTVAITDKHADWFGRGHEPIYKTEAAHNITTAAIENLCLLKIEDRVGPPP